MDKYKINGDFIESNIYDGMESYQDEFVIYMVPEEE